LFITKFSDVSFKQRGPGLFYCAFYQKLLISKCKNRNNAGLTQQINQHRKLS